MKEYGTLGELLTTIKDINNQKIGHCENPLVSQNLTGV